MFYMCVRDALTLMDKCANENNILRQLFFNLYTKNVR